MERQIEQFAHMRTVQSRVASIEEKLQGMDDMQSLLQAMAKHMGIKELRHGAGMPNK